MIFLDSASGTKPYSEVVETVTDILTNHWGNASADYSFGRDAHIIIDNVTAQVAADINCSSGNIIWTSGACEANSLAIRGVLEANEDMLLCMTNLEHTSIEKASHNTPMGIVYLLSNDSCGFIKPDALNKTLEEITRRFGTPLVSVCFANSEIGTIQDIKSIANIVHQYNGILHVDATQMYPWSRIDVQELGIDMMSVSGQKLHCVKGVGFLYVKDGIELSPLIYGSQQDGYRGGTYPTHLIAAFGRALEITRERNATEKVRDLCGKLMDSMQYIDGLTFNGPISTYTYRLPNVISATINGVRADNLIAMCDEYGIMIAKGSACQSYNPVPSKTLLAIGLTEEEALSTIRISLDEFNTEEEVDYVCDMLPKIINFLRDIG